MKAKGQTLGGLKGSKGANVRGKHWLRGELNGIFLQFELRFRNGLGSTLALQSSRITHLINAKILAIFCTRNKNQVEKKHFNVIS